MSKETFMKNYTSLMKKNNNKDLDLVLQFCNYFQSDDLDLFNEYKKYLGNGMQIHNLIELYAKRYDLDFSRDIKQIMKIFLKNTLQEGFCYHLGNSINEESIMKQGFGINSRGLQTEEDKDYELLKSSLDSEVFRELEPFHTTKVHDKTFYSNVPILVARYGDRPEWLIELKKNFDSVKSRLDESSYKLVSDIIEKYDNKYNNTSKQLYLISNPLKIDNQRLEILSSGMAAADLIGYLYSNILSQKDISTDKYISPDDIMSIDLSTYKISYSKDGEIIEYSDSSLNVTNAI